MWRHIKQFLQVIIPATTIFDPLRMEFGKDNKILRNFFILFIPHLIETK